MVDSTRTPPAKPRKDYPLFAHHNGQWAKKVRGKLHYFGMWADPKAALDLWCAQKDDLLAGRAPRAHEAGGITVQYLCNAFLDARAQKHEAGELEWRTWHEYKLVADRVVKAFGKTRVVDDLRPDDFGRLRTAMARRLGKVALANAIQRVRTIFKHGYDNELLDRPVRFGSAFAKPSKKQRRQERNARPPRFLSADEIKTAIGTAPLQLKAMILLGINAGFGNTDCSTLPTAAVDLAAGIVDYPRPKTAVIRRAPLWPETVAALTAVLAKRYEPNDEADKPLLFITKQRHRWSRFNDEVRIDSVAREFGKLLRNAKMHRAGIGFYALRHTFETIAGETGDQAAVDRVMGHERADMATVYREWMRDDRENVRLRRVTDHVHAWLFGETKVETPATVKKTTRRKPKCKKTTDGAA